MRGEEGEKRRGEGGMEFVFVLGRKMKSRRRWKPVSRANAKRKHFADGITAADAVTTATGLIIRRLDHATVTPGPRYLNTVSYSLGAAAALCERLGMVCVCAGL